MPAAGYHSIGSQQHLPSNHRTRSFGLTPLYSHTMSETNVDSTLRAFVRERDWDQFHSAENLAKSIVIEAGELLECFQWGRPKDTASIEEELADVLTYCHLLAMKLGKTPEDLILEKLAITSKKYPISLSRGRSTKYDKL